MHRLRHRATDPRTLARDVGGVFEAVFPQLVTGMIVHLNRTRSYSEAGCKEVPNQLIEQSTLQHSMLFELAVVVAEQLLRDAEIDWNDSLSVASERQRRHFDAQIPLAIELIDKRIATDVAKNLCSSLKSLQLETGDEIIVEPKIPGFRWLSTTCGDFSVGRSIVEVKCTSSRFSMADYRQVILYWLLTYIDSIEKSGNSWESGVLVNPRRNEVVKFQFSEIVSATCGGRSALEVSQAFASMVGERNIE